MKCLSVLANQLFAHFSKPHIEHIAKRIAITK
jgi:hypothetical protein